jgi:diguanylate cyclase (GGDEF)-like protein
VQLNNRRRLAVAGKFALAAAGVLAGVFVLGEFTVGRMLTTDAIGTAQLWSLATLPEGSTDVRQAVAEADDEKLARALNVAKIDRMALLPENGVAVALYGETAAEEADAVLGIPVGKSAAEPSALSSGVHRERAIVSLGDGPVRSWVLFPPDSEQNRLAVRIDQTDIAGELVSSFTRKTLFNGGVAAITFAAFMCGFGYQQRRLSAENAAIRHVAMHDQLTGLPNRKHFEEFMTAALAANARKREKAALFVLDLDGFKSVNDTLGHPVGDSLLKATARRLKESLRVDDFMARLSGDEFVIVVPKVPDATVLAPLADRVLQFLSSPFQIDGHAIQVGCSIGMAISPDNGSDIESLMRNADFALYRAKSEGRRTWRFFDPDMAKDIATRRTLEDGLRQALEKDHFELVYQPQIELATGRTTGYEAMLRWRRPGRGLVPAAAFVSVAEETGLVVPIGEWVIRQVARDCALLPAEHRVAINFSAAQLKRDGIEDFIAETLTSHMISPDRIEIEVNEAVLSRHEAVVLSRLQKFRELGVRIVMDSFGVGTLSLGLLSRSSFDKVKVDRSFLLNDEQKNGAVLAAICGLGRSLGFHVAGQGVETVEHAQLLRAAGCTEAQGYYFAPPMPIEQILQLERNSTVPRRVAMA